MIAPLVFRHASQASQCLTLKHTKSISLTDLIFMAYFQKYLPNRPEKHPMTTLCFSTAAAAAPLSASHPRRPRLDGAAWGGSERPRSRGRAADLCGGQGGRGQQSRPWPRKGFRVVLGVALTRWRKGFVHWQVIFVPCFGMLSGTRTCCLTIHFCEWMGLLKFGLKEMRWNEQKAEGITWSQSVHWIRFLMILSLIPHLALKLWSPYGTNFDSRAVRYFHCQR